MIALLDGGIYWIALAVIVVMLALRIWSNLCLRNRCAPRPPRWTNIEPYAKNPPREVSGNPPMLYNGSEKRKVGQ